MNRKQGQGVAGIPTADELDLALSRHDAAVCAFFHELDRRGGVPGEDEVTLIESWRELRRFFRAAPGLDARRQIGKWAKWEEEHSPRGPRRLH